MRGESTKAVLMSTIGGGFAGGNARAGDLVAMLSLFDTDRTRELRAAAQAFLEREVFAHELAWLREPFANVEPVLRKHKPELRRLGLWNLYHGPEHDGPGLTLPEVARVGEVLGQSPLGLFLVNAQAPDAGNLELLLRYASPELRERYVAPMLAGTLRSCFGMTEPELAGSNPTRLATTARRDGDDYVIDGRKWFTTGADGAALCIVMAVTDPHAGRAHERASMIVVPTDAAGFELVRNIPVMGHTGAGWLSHAEIRLAGVRVPVGNRLGPEHAGFRLAQERLGPGRIHHCMRWIGMAERALGMMVARAARRELADGVTLGEQQMVQAMLAESRAEVEGARLMVLHTAHAIEHRGARAAREQVSLIKFVTAGMLNRVVDRAIQVHGALGVTDDTVLSFFYREERAARIYDGTDETHKASVARAMLRRSVYERPDD